MGKIDWDRPICRMDGTSCDFQVEDWVYSDGYGYMVKDDFGTFYVDEDGCIGSVQVVRNLDGDPETMDEDAHYERLRAMEEEESCDE